MSRLLFLLAVVVVVYTLLKSFRKKVSDREESATEEMVRCAQCGIHLPRSESVHAAGQYFCCDEHRRKYGPK